MNATCDACHRIMDGSSCDAFAWRSRDDGTLTPRRRAAEDCHDCETPRDGFHHLHCDQDVCAHDRQALRCDVCALDVPRLQ